MKKLLLSILLVVIVSSVMGFQQIYAGPGTISGKVYDDMNRSGSFDPGEELVGVDVCADFPDFGSSGFGIDNLLPAAFAGENGRGGFTCDVALAQTDANGDYTIGVSLGSHDVFIIVPPGFFNLSSLIVTANTGDTGVDFLLGTATFPNPDIGVFPLTNHETNGLPTVNWSQDLTITKDVGPGSGFDHCAADQPTAITFDFGPFSETGGMFSERKTSPSSGETWEWTVPAVNPGHGFADLTFTVECPNGPNEIQVGGTVFIDPSGFVRDACTGLVIQGALVELFRNDGFGNLLPPSFFTPNPAQPPIDTQLTDAQGHFQWFVLAGNYQVDVSHPNYIAQSTGPSLFIPPPRFDVDFDLLPTQFPGGCPVASCGNGILEGTEECDDGNQDNGDACSNACLITSGGTVGMNLNLLATCGGTAVSSNPQIIDQNPSVNKEITPLTQTTITSTGTGTAHVEANSEGYRNVNDVERMPASALHFGPSGALDYDMMTAMAAAPNLVTFIQSHLPGASVIVWFLTLVDYNNSVIDPVTLLPQLEPVHTVVTMKFTCPVDLCTPLNAIVNNGVCEVCQLGTADPATNTCI